MVLAVHRPSHCRPAHPVSLRPLDLDPASPDIDAALAVMLEHEREFCEIPDCTRSTVLQQLTGPYALPADHRLAMSGDTPVGVVILESDAARRDVYIDVYAMPDADPTVTADLLAHGIACARRVVDGAEGEWRIESGSILEDAQLSAALTSAGFARQRIYWRMTRSLDDIAPARPAPPPGVTLEVATAPSQRDDLYEVYCASFNGHFGYTHRTRDQYIDAITNGDGSTPDRWWLARLDGSPIALCIQDDSRAESDTAWVRTLGVVPQARGRGVARWLLRCAFADAASRGLSDIGLTVDSDNHTGATRLYESVGMRAHLAIASWRLLA